MFSPLLAFIAGVMQIMMGGLRLGFLVDLVSEPVISGFTSGAAFLIAATQFSNMLGIQKCTKLKGVGECNLYTNATTLEADTTGFSYYASSREGSHSKYTEHPSMMPSGHPHSVHKAYPQSVSQCETACDAIGANGCAGFC